MDLSILAQLKEYNERHKQKESEIMKTQETYIDYKKYVHILIKFAKKYILFKPMNMSDSDIESILPIHRYRLIIETSDDINALLEKNIILNFDNNSKSKINRNNLMINAYLNNKLYKHNIKRYPILVDLGSIYSYNPITINNKYFYLHEKYLLKLQELHATYSLDSLTCECLMNKIKESRELCRIYNTYSSKKIQISLSYKL